MASTAADQAISIFGIFDQAAPVFQGNEVTTITSVAHIAIVSSGSSTGVPQIVGNILTHIGGTTNYLVLVGSETSGAGDNDLDDIIITDNIIGITPALIP